MSAIYFKGQKYTGPTLNLGSGSLTTYDKTIVGGINEINSLYKVVVVEVPSFSSLPQTITDSRITADHVVVYWWVQSNNSMVDDWSVTTSDGSFTISGAMSDISTTLTLVFAIKQ